MSKYDFCCIIADDILPVGQISYFTSRHERSTEKVVAQVTSMVLEVPIVDEEMYRQLLSRRRRLTDRQIADMLQTIRPVVRDGGVLRNIEPAQPRHFAFLRDPQFAGVATGLRPIGVIHTLHPFGYRDRFVPAIDEVLSMIPETLLGEVVAFEVVGPRGEADLIRQRFLVEECDYHVAATILYAAS